MRLIDAEALKEAIKKELPEMSNWGEHFIPMLIDNAPTVEITEEQAIDKLHETGWLIEHDKIMTERPHGKTHAEIFKQTFGIYATELWSMKEADFLKWLNGEEK